MTMQMPPWLLQRVSLTIQDHPGLSRTAVTKLTKGAKQPILFAIDNLIEQGYVAVSQDSSPPSLTSITPYREPEKPPAPDPVEKPLPSDGKPPSRPTLTVVSTEKTTPKKPGEKTTGNGGGTNGNGSGHSRPLPAVQYRCRCCKDAVIRQKINRLLVEGWSSRAILDSLAETNAALPANRRITIDSLQTHREKHFPAQAANSSRWVRLLEEHRAREVAIFDQATANHLNVKAALQGVLIKGWDTLINEETQVSVGEMIVAGRELNRIREAEAGTEQIANVMVKFNKILEVWKMLPGEWQQLLLSKLDGTPGSGHLALLEGTVISDEEEPEEWIGRNDDDED